MDAAELERFHADGFLHVRSVLDGATVAELSALVDAEAAARPGAAWRAHTATEPATSRDDHAVGPFFHWFDGQRQPPATQTVPDRFWFAHLNAAFLQLMAHPAAVERVRSICGAAARLDHSYGIEMRKNWDGNENLHGGPRPELTSNNYYAREPAGGRAWSGMCVVEWALTNVPQLGSGGFMCVPGSHRQPVDAPRPSWPADAHLSHCPPLAAGDFVMFTEAVVHGSRRWVGDGHRRALLFKYSPGFAQEPGCYPADRETMPLLKIATTGEQRYLLRPPDEPGKEPLPPLDDFDVPTPRL
jgi:hypothetical protein